MKVVFKSKKRLIIASMELASQETELGRISFGVAPDTLSLFKRDMLVLAKALSGLNVDPLVVETEVEADATPELTAEPIVSNGRGYGGNSRVQRYVQKMVVATPSESTTIERAPTPGDRVELHGRAFDFVPAHKAHDTLGKQPPLDGNTVDGVSGNLLASFDTASSRLHHEAKDTTTESDLKPQVSREQFDAIVDGLNQIGLETAAEVKSGAKVSFSGTEELSFTASELIDSLLAANTTFIQLLLGRTARGNAVLTRRYWGTTCPDVVAIALGRYTAQRTLTANPDDKVLASNILTSLIDKLDNGKIEYTPENVSALQKLVEILRKRVAPVTKGVATVEWSELLLSILGTEEYRKISVLVKLPSEHLKSSTTSLSKTQAVDWAVFMAAANGLVPEHREFIFGMSGARRNGVTRFSRRCLSDGSNDTLILVPKSPERVRCITSLSLKKITEKFVTATCAFLKCTAYPELVTAITQIVLYLKTEVPVPQKGVPTQCVDWAGEFWKHCGYSLWGDRSSTTTPDVNETPAVKKPTDKPQAKKAVSTTSELVMGFTSASALTKIDALPLGTKFAKEHWPWFFDASGKFDFIQLACRDGEYSLYVRARQSNKSGSFTEIDANYVTVRNAVQLAYVSGTIGTGVVNYPDVEEAFKSYCDAFVVAVLLELNNAYLTTPSKNVVRGFSQSTYLNFERVTDHEEILNALTLPSGRLRVIALGKSSEGIFWYVKSNRIGMGPTIKPRRIRYGKDVVATQIQDLLSELKAKTNLPDDPVLLAEIQVILEREAYRVTSGLV